jgi:hypothetical protein
MVSPASPLQIWESPRRGLEMTPAERLEWLEETVAELREIQGRARLR